jgi:hypothetical protein
MTDDSQLSFSLPSVSRKKVTAAFDGGRLSSDSGVMLVALAERRRALAKTLAALIADRRDPTQWPFLADSPWNTSIGSGAVYEEVIATGLNLATGRKLPFLSRIGGRTGLLLNRLLAPCVAGLGASALLMSTGCHRCPRWPRNSAPTSCDLFRTSLQARKIHTCLPINFRSTRIMLITQISDVTTFSRV